MESTHNLILALFPPEQSHNPSLLALADRVEALVRAGTLHSRLDAVVYHADRQCFREEGNDD